MGKAKKKTNLTLEEKLEQALVSESEQLYEVPDNWVWVRLGSVIRTLRGISYKKHEGHKSPFQDSCLVLRGGNLLEGTFSIIDEGDNIYVSNELVRSAQVIKKMI